MWHRAPNRGLTRVAAWLAALSLTGLAACETPAPRFASGGWSQGEEAWELRRLAEVEFSRAWALPGAGFSAYDRLWVRFGGVAYRQQPRRIARLGRGRGNYALSYDAMERLRRALRESFAEALAGAAGLARTEEAGDGVLEVRIFLRDLVIDQPLSSTGPEDTALAASVGAMTLLIDLHDSVSGRHLARIAERRRIGTETRRPIPITTSDALFESRRIIRTWARRFRALLENLPALDPHPV